VDSTHWDAVLESWQDSPAASRLRAYSDEANRALLEAWLPKQCGRVLKTDAFDEAVAEGLAPFLAARSERLVEVDASPATVAAARARHPDLDALVADVRSLPFEDGSFDVVVSNSTLDHFPSLDDVESAVRELQRVLAPAGLLIVTLDNLRNPLVSLRNALPYPLLHRLGLVPYYVGATCGPRRLQRLLEAAGFGVEELAALLHVPRVLARALRLPVRVLLAGERLGHAPTRFVTGQFVAARARKP
jgi:SAM-dependent methyltransferase